MAAITHKGSSVMRRLLLLGVLGFGVYLAIAFWRDRSHESELREAATDMLGNFHPGHVPRMRALLVGRAAKLGIALGDDSVKIDRRPTDQSNIVSRVSGQLGLAVTQNFEVSIAISYKSSILGISRRHELRVARVIAVEKHGGKSTAAEKGAGLPLPEMEE
jgi:hypothetical protein